MLAIEEIAKVLFTTSKKDLLAWHCKEAQLSKVTFYDILVKFPKIIVSWVLLSRLYFSFQPVVA